jgi:uncharacterized protein YjbJ (UPF0337 family)
LIGNPNLDAEGKAERIEGLAQGGLGCERREVGELLKRVDNDRMKNGR